MRHFVCYFNGSGKTLHEVLTVADAISLPIAGPRVNGSLSRHGSVRLSPQRKDNRIWSQMPRHGCHPLPCGWVLAQKPCYPVMHKRVLEVSVPRRALRTGLPVAAGYTSMLSGEVRQMPNSSSEPACGGRRYPDAFQKSQNRNVSIRIFLCLM